MAWGVIEPNTFGTDEFVELCRLVGWEPYICNNAGNGTTDEMKNWVEYCNGTEGKYAQLRKDNGYAEPRNVRSGALATRTMETGNRQQAHRAMGAAGP